MRQRWRQVNSVSVGLQNPKLPLDWHPSGSEVRDRPPIAGSFKRAGLGSSGIRSDVNSDGLPIHLDSPKSIIIVVFVKNDQPKIFFFFTKIAI